MLFCGSSLGIGSGDDWIPPEYQSYQFSGDFACLAGNDLARPANPGGSNGNGYIRITYIPPSAPETPEVPDPELDEPVPESVAGEI